MIQIIKNPKGLPETLKSRSQLTDEKILMVVKKIVKDVQTRGDEAVLEYSAQFDDSPYADARQMRVTRGEIEEAYAVCDKDLLVSMKRAASNITAFHEKQKQKTWLSLEGDITLGQMITPLESVGIYVPGGTAGYPSTALMNMLPAVVTGVSRVVMVTPPGKDGKASFPLALVAADIAGVSEIYKVGGAQAVAALAFGTNTIPKVDKIVGPGNIYVANAKREVFGHVGIDMIAGPSEVLVIADDSANPAYVAADLLSQAEHDAYAACVLITTSQRIATNVQQELDKQLLTLPRNKIALESLSKYGTILLVDDLSKAVQLSNDFAPEHLELAVTSPFELLGQIKNAGAIFLGHYTPEPVGDYFAGPNHVLPTSGTARFSSPLSVDDFVKKSSILQYSQKALASASHDIVRFARAEGLDAHANAISIRERE